MVVLLPMLGVLVIVAVVFLLIYGNARAQGLSKGESRQVGVKYTLIFTAVVLALIVGAGLVCMGFVDRAPSIE